MAISALLPTHRYAAAALLSLALHQAQIHQTRPLGSSKDDDDDGQNEERVSSSSSTDSVSEDPLLWIHENFGLLRPVFRILEIDPTAWHGLEETGFSTSAKHHIGAFIRLLSEEGGENSSERSDQELALTKSVDALEMSLETAPASFEAAMENYRKQENDFSKNSSSCEKQPAPEAGNIASETFQQLCSETSIKEDTSTEFDSNFTEEPVEEITLLSYQRKVAVLYELLSACLASSNETDKRSSHKRKAYDARHRVALRLLATWLDIKWIKVEAMEVMVASSAMALMKQAEPAEQESKSPKGKWAAWKRGGIIGAAAITGGTLLAITGGLAAPAIAAGFGALAPTLGAIVPVIGAGGFAAVAGAAGSVAGSVAVAASFGAAGAGLSGVKMARRTGSVDEFEIKPVGDNHNQGRLAVGILVAGFVFEEEDFIKPWEGKDNLERYALQWESKNLIAVSTAIQDWLTSRIAFELMKQGAMMTVLSTLLAALAWPATLLTATDFIDSKWSIAVDRSDKAGEILAEEVLLKGLQGNRPVTLVGFSLGARVIFKCLQILAKSEDNVGIVERVVLLGAPLSINNENWKAVRTVVSGRFVNCYSTSDWTLGIAFRASLLTQGLAGIQSVDVPGIENVDVTELIDGHSAYLWKTRAILEHLEMDTYYPVFKSLNFPTTDVPEEVKGSAT
ncbi:hypothetical protein C5167_010237 [Papaver somniferum]|uniref:DUF726 domain-containing protein n=1 Tax=Papaver somniferum TaxID=3469 RepID=A0A4Y7K2G8_PAPSO|nr:transmembrane and coiled-coil domain-containing protein 4-like [Papaver somniferum]RZC66542.1 hypothetical protein C5167_010237 [Papaver somniferum]